MTAFGWNLEIPDGFLVAGWRQRKSDGRGIKSQCSGTSERQFGREGFWCGRIAFFGIANILTGLPLIGLEYWII